MWYTWVWYCYVTELHTYDFVIKDFVIKKGGKENLEGWARETKEKNKQIRLHQTFCTAKEINKMKIQLNECGKIFANNAFVNIQTVLKTHTTQHT